MSKKREITVTLNEPEIESLEKLAEWLEVKKGETRDLDKFETIEHWQETIESILEEEK